MAENGVMRRTGEKHRIARAKRHESSVSRVRRMSPFSAILDSEDATDGSERVSGHASTLELSVWTLASVSVRHSSRVRVAVVCVFPLIRSVDAAGG